VSESPAPSEGTASASASGTPSSSPVNPLGSAEPPANPLGNTAAPATDGASSTPSPAASQPVGLGQTFRHDGGAEFRYPDGWKVQEAGQGVTLVPPDLRTTEQGPLEVYLATTTPTEGVTDIRSPEISQGASEILQLFGGFLRPKGQPQYRQIGPHAAILVTAEGKSPTGVDAVGRLYGTIIGSDAFVIVAIAPRDLIEKRAPVIESVFGTLKRGAPQIDKRFVGVWRNTETYVSGGFSAVTETYLVLAADGTCGRGTKLSASDYTYDSSDDLVSSASAGSDSDMLQGRWSMSGKTLKLMFPGGVEEYAAYAEGAPGGQTLMLTAGGKRKIWYQTR